MRTVCLLGLAAALSCPATVSAYFVQSRTNDAMGNPVPLAYDTSAPVEFRVDSAGAPGIDDGSEYTAIAAAFQSWEDVDCVTIDFEEGAQVDNPMGMHWMTGELNIYVYWSDDPALFPSASVGFWDMASDGEGTLIAGQIILNSRHFTWATDGDTEAMDIQSVVTAGVGKILGISSTMMGNATYSVYSNGDTSKRTLGTDDIAAIQFLYGDGATCPDVGEPEMICPTRDCPPDIIEPPDAGPLPDSGTMMGSDSGTMMGTDAGTMFPPPADDDGCSCTAAGTDRSPLAGALAGLLVVGWMVSRRRRRP